MRKLCLILALAMTASPVWSQFRGKTTPVSGKGTTGRIGGIGTGVSGGTLKTNTGPALIGSVLTPLGSPKVIKSPAATTISAALPAAAIGAPVMSGSRIPGASQGTGRTTFGRRSDDSSGNSGNGGNDGAGRRGPEGKDYPQQFVEVLGRLGVPSNLISMIQDYLQRPELHPGDQEKVYHGVRHSHGVPSLTAILGETQVGMDLGVKDVITLIVSAVLHDIDPARPVGSQARVGATLLFMDSDPGTVALMNSYADFMGIPRARFVDTVRLYIKRTDFNPNEKVMDKINEDYETMLQDLARTPEERVKLLYAAEFLAYSDKMETYVLTEPEELDKIVLNLAEEFRKGIAAGTLPADTFIPSLEGTHFFLKNFLGEGPFFEMLPANVKTRFEKTVSHFAVHAEAATKRKEAAEAKKSRGPPQAAAILDKAREEAARITTDQTAVSSPDLLTIDAENLLAEIDAKEERIENELANFNRDSFAILPPGSIMSADEEAQFLKNIDAGLKRDGKPIFSVWELKEINSEWNERFPALKKINPFAQAFLSRLTTRLMKALPGERLRVYDVQLRLVDGEQPVGDALHVDGNYITVTYAIKGPGTMVYHKKADGTVEVLQAGQGDVSILSNRDRDHVKGIHGAVHSAPQGVVSERTTIIVRYSIEDMPELTQEQRDRLLHRAQLSVDYIQAALRKRR